ncbi:MAG: cell wall-binding repeat-containing protein, partial [Acidimicrobiales bacterium]
WATDHGAQIINLSLGGCDDPTEAAAVRYAQRHGVLIVAAAGNDAFDGNPIEYPAAYPGVIGVGATGRDGTKAAYSEVGPGVALVAPGGSADGNPSDDIPVLASGGGTTTAAGTSFSAPQVAGAAALILAADGSLAPDDAGALVVASAATTHASPNPAYGRGMLDASAALRAAAVLRRVAGSDRYATSAALSRAGWPQTSSVVYVASGEVFADALATGAAAGLNRAPILLTNQCSLPPATSAELRRLTPTTVYIVGGVTAVCEQVARAIGQLTGVTPVRIGGTDRYDTNAQLVATTWKSTAPLAFVTTGVNFPDGLTGSARAAKDGAPLLLTDTCLLPSATRAELLRLAPRVVKVFGGTSAICPGVLDAISAATGGAQVVRIAGPDRVQTATLIAEDGWSRASAPIVASAGNFPDALSASAYAGVTGMPVLINDTCASDVPVLAALRSFIAATFTVAGGVAALCGAAVAPLAVGLVS